MNIIKRWGDENKKENQLDDLPLYPTITLKDKVEIIYFCQTYNYIVLI